MPVSSYKELPEGHPFKGAHVFFGPKQQASSQKSLTEQTPQANLVRELEAKGIKTNVFSREDLKRKRSPDPKPGDWPRE